MRPQRRPSAPSSAGATRPARPRSSSSGAAPAPPSGSSRVGHTASRNGDPLAGAPVAPAARGRIRTAPPCADRRLAERALRRPAAAGRGGEGLRAVRRPAAAARRAPGRRRAADEHLAGVQPPRRRRRTASATAGTRTRASRASTSTRPYLDRGVPPRFRGYDRGFLRWLALHGANADFLADDDLERAGDGRLAGAALRPDRLPGPRGVRHDARLRRDRAVPRPRRQPRLPLGEQLLLPRRAARPAPVQDGKVARPRPPRSRARRRAVRRLEPQPLPEPGVHGHRRRRGPAGCSRARGLRERRPLRALRDRDRREDVTARRAGSRCSHGSATPSAPASAPR